MNSIADSSGHVSYCIRDISVGVWGRIMEYVGFRGYMQVRHTCRWGFALTEKLLEHRGVRMFMLEEAEAAWSRGNEAQMISMMKFMKMNTYWETQGLRQVDQWMCTRNGMIALASLCINANDDLSRTLVNRIKSSFGYVEEREQGLAGVMMLMRCGGVVNDEYFRGQIVMMVYILMTHTTRMRDDFFNYLDRRWDRLQSCEVKVLRELSAGLKNKYNCRQWIVFLKRVIEDREHSWEGRMQGLRLYWHMVEHYEEREYEVGFRKVVEGVIGREWRYGMPLNWVGELAKIISERIKEEANEERQRRVGALEKLARKSEGIQVLLGEVILNLVTDPEVKLHNTSYMEICRRMASYNDKQVLRDRFLLSTLFLYKRQSLEFSPVSFGSVMGMCRDICGRLGDAEVDEIMNFRGRRVSVLSLINVGQRMPTELCGIIARHILHRWGDPVMALLLRKNDTDVYRMVLDEIEVMVRNPITNMRELMTVLRVLDHILDTRSEYTFRVTELCIELGLNKGLDLDQIGTVVNTINHRYYQEYVPGRLRRLETHTNIRLARGQWEVGLKRIYLERWAPLYSKQNSITAVCTAECGVIWAGQGNAMVRFLTTFYSEPEVEILVTILELK